MTVRIRDWRFPNADTAESVIAQALYRRRPVERSLEGQSQSQLHCAWIPRSVDPSKLVVGLNSRGAEVRIGVHIAELRVVENVVNFPTKLQVTRFAPQIELLENGHVLVVRARKPDHVFRRITDFAPPRRRKGGCVEPAIRRSLVARQNGISRDP
jgi:hypothetical protein